MCVHYVVTTKCYKCENRLDNSMTIQAAVQMTQAKCVSVPQVKNLSESKKGHGPCWCLERKFGIFILFKLSHFCEFSELSKLLRTHKHVEYLKGRKLFH